MKEIELIIKIPEEIRLALINNVQLYLDQQSICDSCIKQAIVNGTPLPKAENHGFIAVCDSLGAVTQEVVDKLKNTVFVGDEDCSYCFDIMEIIDADDTDTETWNGYHGQVTAPKGTFKRIYADADGGDAE